ncbi:MAG: hypothetical protein HYZ08_00885 [Candidatus Kerfeldbacteria bacterium]|nr:hypothetical protein [Candidatus Kerfeldbacteria bacterium]
MQDTIIELEIRAEVDSRDLEKLKRHLDETGTLDSHTKRLSVMCFGRLGAESIDLRTRITNGRCEVVVKKGSLGAHDRLEIAQDIASNQWMGFVRIFMQLGFPATIGERETMNYRLPGGVTASLVLAGSVSYIELEKISVRDDVGQHRRDLHAAAKQLGLQLLRSEAEFNALCHHLDETVDWSFSGSDADYIRLEQLFNTYLVQ